MLIALFIIVMLVTTWTFYSQHFNGKLTVGNFGRRLLSGVLYACLTVLYIPVFFANVPADMMQLYKDLLNRVERYGVHLD